MTAGLLSRYGAARRWRNGNRSRRSMQTERGMASQNKLAQILALHDRAELVADELAVHDYALLGQVRALVTHFLDHLLQDGVQAAGADVLGRAVHLEGDVGHRLDPV